MAETLSSALDDWTTELDRQREVIRSLAELDAVSFNWRPAPKKWSIGENVEHLSLTVGPYLERIEPAIREGPAAGRTGPGPWKRGLLVNWFVRSMEPPVKMRFPTAPMLVPGSDLNPGDTTGQLLRLMGDLTEAIASMKGLDLGRCTFRSPILALLKLDLGSGVDLLVTHNRRHLWAIDQIRQAPGYPGQASER